MKKLILTSLMLSCITLFSIAHENGKCEKKCADKTSGKEACKVTTCGTTVKNSEVTKGENKACCKTAEAKKSEKQNCTK